jgi:ribonuclease HI
MNQRIAVRALIKKDEKVLLLRRASGRQSILGKYELPGGRVDHGEQPEEALTRHLRETTGLSPQTIQLADVLTYVDHDNRDIQYAIILYFVSIVSVGSDVNLNTNYDHYIWRKPSSVRQDELTELSQLLLNIQDRESSPATSHQMNGEDDKTATGQLVIYSDGGSRGNPGPSAAGYVILDARGDLIDEGGSYIGITTNNQAEYHGVHLGLEKARELGARSIEFRLDSLLVVNQLNGTYVIRNRELWPIHERVRALMAEFEKVTFRHVKREFNQRADIMVNKILDAHTKEKV